MSAPGSVRAVEGVRTDWETPDWLFDALNAEFRFDLDGAASSENTKVLESFYSPAQDAFRQMPTERRIWLNPPYGRQLPQWISLIEIWSHRNLVVALLPSNTDTAWFRHVWETADEVRFLQRRVQFVGTTTSNPNGSVIAVWYPGQRRAFRGPRVALWDVRQRKGD